MNRVERHNEPSSRMLKKCASSQTMAREARDRDRLRLQGSRNEAKRAIRELRKWRC